MNMSVKSVKQINTQFKRIRDKMQTHIWRGNCRTLCLIISFSSVTFRYITTLVLNFHDVLLKTWFCIITKH